MCLLDQEEIEELMTSSVMGICTECCTVQSGVEPDAEGYICEECGADAVMGIENAIISMELDIK